MMIFDGHADLLYDVTKWRQAGEDRVFERRHLPRLQAGQIGGLGLSIWTTVEPVSYTHLISPPAVFCAGRAVRFRRGSSCGSACPSH